MKDLQKVAKEAKKILEQLEGGKKYHAVYVISRFEKAASECPTDQLIGNMRDVLVKMARKQDTFSQTEIGKLYDEMIGFSGGQSGFRTHLEDLLPQDRKFAKVAYPNSNKRVGEGEALDSIFKDSELSQAFSVIFSMGEGDSSFGTYKKADSKEVQKAVITKLSAMGYAPVDIAVGKGNEHFTLCTAFYKTKSFDKVAVQIPVQIKDGSPLIPTLMIQDSDTVPLTKENLYVYLKDEARHRKMAAIGGLGRAKDDRSIEMDKVVVPSGLEKFADLENHLVAVANNFNVEQMTKATKMLDSELSALGFKGSVIKVASAKKDELTFNVQLPTNANISIKIPVQFQNSKICLPSKFASDINSEEKIFDFSEAGIKRFLSLALKGAEVVKIARDYNSLGTMSYNQLMDQMLDAVSNKNYDIAEDVLSQVQLKYPDHYKSALENYGSLLKHSSTVGTKTKDFVKQAQKRGELITIPTSIELYCPKLGLPLSKIEFDDDGQMYPKGRGPKSKITQDDKIGISTSKVFFN